MTSIKTIILILAVIFLGGCKTEMTAETARQAVNNNTDDKKSPRRTIPLIDRQRPEVFKTASFGLG